MVKIIASVILSLSFLFLVKEAVVSYRSDYEYAGDANVPKKAKPQPVIPPEKKVVFYPPVPAALPDLNQGYLFNAERFLPGDNEEEAADTDNGQDVSVDIATVSYAGSIIAGDIRKGLIVYPPPKTPPPAAIGANKNAPAPLKPRNYTQLVAGDTVSGYKVVAIEPEKLVLQKGEETIEKMLIDPKKDRIAPPPPAPKPKAAPKTRATVTRKSSAPVSSRRTSATRRVPAPRALPDNVKIQTPGVPRNN
ncbi:MAG: hypothetical protein V1706_02750 [Pseudomonadota bacterium]